jgi:hypothetical protein
LWQGFGAFLCEEKIMNKRLVLLGALVATGCQGPGVTPLPVAAPQATYQVLQACPVPSEAPTPAPSPTVDPLIQRFLVTLSGAAEVPPRETPGGGQGRVVYSRDSDLIQYDVRLTGLKNVTVAHFHLGAPGENGPPVAVLYGPVAAGGGTSPGRLVDVVRASDLIGPMAGKTLRELAAEMAAGNVYVNVHTDDGVAPPNTGAGDFPDGEVRGQLVTEVE